MSLPSNEYELVSQLVKGDARAFTEIFELYKDTVFAFAYSLTKSRDTAEEVVQDVFLKLWERRAQVKVDNSFTAYVKTVTYNQVIDFFRKAKNDRNMQQRIFRKVEQLRSGSEEYLLGKELDKLYHEAVNNLSPQQKKAYLMSREQDMSYDEIAHALGLSRNTVRNHIAEAIRSIRQYVTTNSDLAVLVIALCLMHKKG
jgi:RNA polymerase sigma-70 factor (ECF subfamily)